MIDAMDDRMLMVRKAEDIERAHREGKYGVVIDFQETTPFSDKLERIDSVPQHGPAHVPA